MIFNAKGARVATEKGIKMVSFRYGIKDLVNEIPEIVQSLLAFPLRPLRLLR